MAGLKSCITLSIGVMDKVFIVHSIIPGRSHLSEANWYYSEYFLSSLLKRGRKGGKSGLQFSLVHFLSRGFLSSLEAGWGSNWPLHVTYPKDSRSSPANAAQTDFSLVVSRCRNISETSGQKSAWAASAGYARAALRCELENKFWLTSFLATAWLIQDSHRCPAPLCLQRKVPAFFPPLLETYNDVNI